MAISDKLTYLNTTKQKIKEMINYGLDEDNQIVPTVGKNLARISADYLNESAGITPSYDTQTGGITLSGTKSGTSTVDFTSNIPITLKANTTYTLSIQPALTHNLNISLSSGVGLGITAGFTSISFTPTVDVDSYNMYFGGVSAGTVLNETIYLQIEEGSTATAFEKFEILDRFRSYPDYIFKAFLESLNNPSTLFTNLPKITGTGSNITLNNTANAPMRIELGASELTQDGTPTPDSPQDIHTISGDNKVVVCGKNLFDGKSITQSTYVYPCKIGDTFTLSFTGYTTAGDKRIFLRTTNETFTTTINSKTDESVVTITETSASYSLTVTSTINGYVYIRCGGGYGFYVLSNIQVEKSSTATTYEPYISQEADIDLGVENLFNEYKITLVSTGTNNNGVITSTENTTAGTKNTKVYFSNDAISVKSGQTLYFSADIKLDDNSTGSFGNINDGVNGTTTKIIEPTLSTEYQRYQTSFTYSADTTVNAILLQVGSLVGTFTAKNIQISFEKSPSYSKFGVEPIEYGAINDYKNKFIRTSGKNLFDISVATNDYLFTKTGDVFTSSPLSAYVVPKIKLGRSINVKNGQDYYISYDIKLDSGDVKNLNYFGRLSDTGSLAKNTNFGSLVGSFTISNQYQRVVWKTTATYDFKANYLFMQATSPITTSQVISIKNIQIATSNIPYEPYGSNEWYIKKNIGKVVLDGTEQWGNDGQSRGYTTNFIDYHSSNALCNIAVYEPTTTTWTAIGKFGLNASGVCWFRLDTTQTDFSNVNNWKAWLGTHNTIVYYVLATPTYTQITGTLETQLENVYQKLLSYTGQTNISQVNNDLAFNMNVSALQDLSTL